MDQLKMLQLFSKGRDKIQTIHQLIHSAKEESISPHDKKTLLSLREWFYDSAAKIKNTLQDDEHMDDTKRQMLEKLITDYTFIICEIDKKVNIENEGQKN